MASGLVSVRYGAGVGYLKNLDRLMARLARIPAEVRKEMAEVVKAEAENLAGDMRKLAPVAPEFERHPGDLRETIRVEPGRSEISAQVVCDPKDTHGQGYAAHVEYGHRFVDGAHAAPKPFFHPAIRANRARINRAFAAAARKGMRAAWS